MRSFQRYWHWWVGQVSDALPKLSSVRKRAAIAAVRRDGGLVLQVRDDPGTVLGVLHLDTPEHARQHLLSRIGAVTLGNNRVVLLIPEDAGLQRQVELPIAAESHLDTVAANELDRWTPWRPDQAVFSAKIVERSPAVGKIVVELTAVPHFVFSEASELLKDTGLTLIGVLRARGDQPNQFIEVAAESRSSLRLQGLKAGGLALAGGIVLILSAVFAQKMIAINALETRLTDIAGEVEATQKLVEESRALALRAGYADEIKSARPSAIIVLNALSAMLPDDCWLEQMSMEGDKLQIQGHAQDALSLLALLNSSGQFIDVKFESEIVADPEAGSESFNLSATALPYAAQ